MWPLRLSQGKIEGSLRAFGRAGDGSVAATTAMALVAIIGMAALAIDLGQAYNVSTEFNQAADAAALAGATQLDQTPGSCLRAIAAASNPNLANKETFASNAGGPDIFIDPTPDPIANANIRFLSDLVKDANGLLIDTYITVAADCDSTAVYIEVTVDRASNNAGDDYRVDFSLAPIVGVSEAFPIGYAVAAMGKAYCDVVPMMMCEFENPPPGGLPAAPLTYANLVANPEDYRGLGIYLKAGKANVQWGSGNFGFLVVPGADPGGGPKGLCGSLGLVKPPLPCLGLKNLETKPGDNAGARLCFNTRFDIYAGSVKGNKGNRDWQPAANTVKGLVRKGNSCGEVGKGWGGPLVAYDGTPVGPANPLNTVMPPPMDSCAYGGGCDGTDEDSRLGHGGWDLESYLNVNQPGMSIGDLEWDLELGVGDKITRYDIYKWELGYYLGNSYGVGDYGLLGIVNPPQTTHHIVNNTDQFVPPPPALTTPQTAEYGGPQCYTGPMGHPDLKSDRRVIKIAMVDCDRPQGHDKDVTAEGFMEVFVLTPWVVQGGDHEIYVEVIGPVNFAGNRGTVVVQLYE